MVVGEVLVNLRAEDLDGGTRRHHSKKNHQNSRSRHCWSMKDTLFLLLKEALLESFNLQKKTNNEREIKCFIVR